MSQPGSHAANGQEPRRTEATKGSKAKSAKGDVYVDSMAAGNRPVPGSRSVNGQKAVSRLVDRAIAKVRARIRERAAGA